MEQVSQEFRLADNAPYVLVTGEVCRRVVERVGAERILDPLRDMSIADPEGGVLDWARSWMQRLRREISSVDAEDITVEDAIEVLQASVTVFAPKSSSLLIVGYETADPVLARDTLQAFMEEAVDWHLKVYSDERQIQIVEKQHQLAQDAYGKAVDAQERFVEALSISDFDTEFEMRRERLKSVEDRLLENEARLKSQFQHTEAIRVRMNGVEPTLVVTEQVEQDDGKVASYQEQLTQLETELRDLRTRYQPDDPRIAQAISRRDSVADLLATAKATPKPVVTQTRTMENPEYRLLEQRHLESQLEMQTTGELVIRLREQVVGLRQEVDDLARHRNEWVGIQRDVERTRAELTRTEDQMSLARTKQLLSQNQVSSLTVLQQPTEAIRLSTPRSRLVLVGLIGGLAAGIGWAAFRAFADSTVRTSDDLEQTAGLPVLASYPSPTRRSVKRHLLNRSLEC
jgi:hypothetical protein